MSELGDYLFQPSAAGHSLARIDALFQQLLDRRADAAADGPDASWSPGSAMTSSSRRGSLIAQQLGFPARVVVGVRLGTDVGAATCPDGACRGRDLSAWIEVKSADGAWVPVDVTPQHTEPIDSDARRQRDPENVTEVRPETAEEIVAPDPVQRDTGNGESPEQPPPDLSALWAALGWPRSLVLRSPSDSLPVRRGRESHAASLPAAGTVDIADRVVGGWDEFVDAAVDHGRPAPRAETRTELARSTRRHARHAWRRAPIVPSSRRSPRPT